MTNIQYLLNQALVNENKNQITSLEILVSIEQAKITYSLPNCSTLQKSVAYERSIEGILDLNEFTGLESFVFSPSGRLTPSSAKISRVKFDKCLNLYRIEVPRLTEVGIAGEQKKVIDDLKKDLGLKVRELQTERATTQKALQTSQTWHERQKAEIIDQWKAKLQTFIDKRKTSLQQEIELIREVLND